MKDNLKEYNVTVYLTVAVTAHGVRARTPTHAAMDLGVLFGGYLDRDAFLRETLCQGDQTLVVNGVAVTANAEVVDDVSGFLVQTAGTEEAVVLDRNGAEAHED